MADTPPYHQFMRTETRAGYEGRYWNANGKGIAVVAIVKDGVDWSAYIGADNGYLEKECLNWTTKYGAKLREADARHFFPDIDLPYRQ